jgi:hypothetical protein
MRTHGTPSKATITNKTSPAMGHFPPASQAGRLAGPVFYVYIFTLQMALNSEAVFLNFEEAQKSIPRKRFPSSPQFKSRPDPLLSSIFLSISIRRF